MTNMAFRSSSLTRSAKSAALKSISCAPARWPSANSSGVRTSMSVRVHVGALQDEESVGNVKIERFLDGPSDR